MRIHPLIAVRSSASHGQRGGANEAADRDDIAATRRIANGARMLGLAEVRGYYIMALRVIPELVVPAPAPQNTSVWAQVLDVQGQPIPKLVVSISVSADGHLLVGPDRRSKITRVPPERLGGRKV